MLIKIINQLLNCNEELTLMVCCLIDITMLYLIITLKLSTKSHFFIHIYIYTKPMNKNLKSLDKAFKQLRIIYQSAFKLIIGITVILWL